jgi:hypothetical protein
MRVRARGIFVFGMMTVFVWARCAGHVRLVCVLVTIEHVDVAVWKGKPVAGVVGTRDMGVGEGRRELCGCVGLCFCILCGVCWFGCDLCRVVGQPVFERHRC